MNQLQTWLVEDRIIFTSLIGPLTVDMFPGMDERIIAMLEASSGTNIHIIADISMMTTMPNVIQMAKLKYPSHPKVGIFLTQGRNPIEKFIGGTVGQMFKSNYKFINDLEQGIRFLAEYDTTLPSANEMMRRINEIRNQFIKDASES
ncbi:MAG: hypothetical protein KC546_21415 [Anaerolineae bacterium]|nr:hypothetical protein [Anaerolineae bacterium]